MNRKNTIALIIVFFTVQLLFAQTNLPDGDFHGIRNNEFYLESLRLTVLAQDTYEYGDYDASASFAEEAIRYARLSDEYIAIQLKESANNAIAAARQRLDWVDSHNAADRYPDEYRESKAWFEASQAAYSAEEWEEAIIAATKVVEILAFIEGGPVPLPSQYTVRFWASTKDCLWNIAGYSWIYGDPEKWRVLYNANKSKFPEPDNPNLIEPGMVLEIPSISGEVRQGMWDPAKAYP